GRLEARGTVRLALKEAGLDVRSVTRSQMVVVVERVLPQALSSRGVQDFDELCKEWKARLSALQTRSTPDTPDLVFERLGRSGS
nr:hypothetical protein [Myxococcota bacterium]